MKRLQKFSTDNRKLALVHNYLYQVPNGLRDIIINVRQEKVFVQRLFVERWKNLRQTELQSLGVAERLLISIIINDFVLRLDLLEKVVQAIPAISLEEYPNETLVSVGLEDSSIINILLSEATCRLVRKHQDDLDSLRIDVGKTLEIIDRWFWGENSGESFTGAFALLIKQYLPPLIFSSIAGFVDYACLDKRVLERATRTHVTPKVEPDETQDLQRQEQLNPESDTSRWWFARQLQNWLKEQVKGVISRNAILLQIDTSILHLLDLDTVAYLYVDWVRYLITFGSRFKSKLKPSTIEQYSRLVFRYLFESINPQLTIDEFLTQHMEFHNIPILSDIAGSSAQQLNAAMDVFKTYLLEIHSVETDIAEMSPYQGMTEAEIVWPCEIHEASRQARLIPDRTLSVNCTIAFVLSTLVRLRISELLALKIRDFQISKLEAALLLRIRRSKSDAGERTVRIPLENADLIVEFLRHRIDVDKAGSKVSLWGNYETDDVYRKSAFVSKINGILKQVTGDTTARYHWLSHSKVTSEFWQLFSGHSRYLQQPNPVFALVADLGHLSYETSWSTYTHCADHLIVQAARNLWGLIPRECLPSFELRMWLSAASINTYKSTVRRGNSRGVFVGQSHARMIYGHELNKAVPPFDQSVLQFPVFQDIWPKTRKIADLIPVDIFKLVCVFTHNGVIDRANLVQQFGFDREMFDRIYWVLAGYGRFESVSAWNPDVLSYSTHLKKAFSPGFRHITNAMLLALNAGSFNRNEDYFYLREIFTSKNVVLPLSDPRVKRLIDFLKTSGVEPGQCSFEIGVLVPRSDSDQLINLFRYTYLSVPRVSYCKGSGRKQVRLHVYKPDLRSTSTAFNSENESLVGSVTEKRSRSGNRAAIGVCVQAAFFCQIVVWDLRQRGGL